MPRRQKRYHYFYKTTCNITNRYYYGMHSTHNLDDGYIGSGKRLWYSINKYGRENHNLKILEFFDTRKKLKQKEIDFVNENLLKDPMCMNLQPGGGGGFSIDQQKKNAKNSYKKQQWLRKNDKIWTNRVALHISEGNKKSYQNGRIPNPPDWTGKKHKEESKQKMKETHKFNNHQQGEKNSQYRTCWITNGKENKKIKKEDIIPIDWRLGRKMG